MNGEYFQLDLFCSICGEALPQFYHYLDHIDQLDGIK